MNQRAIVLGLLALIGIPILILIGQWSATDPIWAGVSAMVVVGIFILFQLGSKCWLLIPFFAAFTGSLNILPGHFAPRDLAVGLVAVILPLIWVVRRFPIRIRIGNLEIALLILLAFVGQAFLRNPVGLSIFGSATIGGRPYFEIAISVVAFSLLSILIVDFKSVRMMVFANFWGNITVALYETAIGLFPGLAYHSASIYHSGTTSTALKEYFGLGAAPGQGTGRMMYLRLFAKPIMTLVLSFKSPLQLLTPRNCGFLFLAVFAGSCILLSGFRSGIAGIGLLVIAAVFLHRKPMQLIIMGMFGGPILAVVLVMQGNVFNLPLSAQRALSFLPADWDSRATIEAEGSSEWRFQMWREALTSDRYIRNKWLGDGYGFTAEELAYQQALMMGGSTTKDQQDYYLSVGSYHSGPVETIKRVGYLGLGTLLIVMMVFFKEAVSLVNRARGSPYFPYAIFVALPPVILPFMFVFVFGAFQEAASSLLLAGGMIRLISNSIEKSEISFKVDAAAVSASE